MSETKSLGLALLLACAASLACIVGAVWYIQWRVPESRRDDARVWLMLVSPLIIFGALIAYSLYLIFGELS
jgi:hypothetical protein